MFIEGTPVQYKDHYGVIAFVAKRSVSILIKKGEHKSHDVKLVVYAQSFKDIIILNEK